MKKIVVIVFLLSFVVSIVRANNEVRNSKTMESNVKKQSNVVKNDQQIFWKLDGDVVSHFVFVTVINQDILSEFEMSLKSDFEPRYNGEEGELFIEQNRNVFTPSSGYFNTKKDLESGSK